MSYKFKPKIIIIIIILCFHNYDDVTKEQFNIITTKVSLWYIDSNISQALNTRQVFTIIIIILNNEVDTIDTHVHTSTN